MPTCPTCWENCEECGPPVGPVLACAGVSINGNRPRFYSGSSSVVRREDCPILCLIEAALDATDERESDEGG